MKKTALSLLTLSILAGSAHAQTQQPGSPAITPPASSTSITTKSTTTEVVSPAHDARSHSTVLEDVSNDDPLNPTPDPLDPATTPVDSRAPLTPMPSMDRTTPIAPSVTPNPKITPVKGADRNVNDVSTMESNLEFTPVLNYDTDSDGMLDTREFLNGPISPERTRLESTTEIKSTTTEIAPASTPMP